MVHFQYLIISEQDLGFHPIGHGLLSTQYGFLAFFYSMYCNILTKI
jgi:hypothetical protein